MPRGDKSSYSGKQKRQAEHIEEGYEHRGVKPKEAKRRAWATVNKTTHGGKKLALGGAGKRIMLLRVKAVARAEERRTAPDLPSRNRALFPAWFVTTGEFAKAASKKRDGRWR
jgi:hypothetical protein